MYREEIFITLEKRRLDARAFARRREHQIARFLREKGVPAFHTDVFDIIIYVLGEWYGIELKENHRKEEKWNLTVHTNTWKNQMRLAQKTSLKRAVIYISEHVGNWVIHDNEAIDQKVKASRGQLTRMTIRKLERIELEKWLNMIGIIGEDARF